MNKCTNERNSLTAPGCDWEEFITLWRRFNRENKLALSLDDEDALPGLPVVYARTHQNTLLYVGMTNDAERRDAEHLVGSHNKSLREAHENGFLTKGRVIGSCYSKDTDVLEQRAVAIARSLADDVCNVVRGGTFNSEEKKFFDVYMKRKRLDWISFKNIVHGILPMGHFTLKLLGFYENDDRVVMYLEDKNGWIYFNIVPKNNVKYAQRNAERIERWNSWRKWTGMNVDVQVRSVNGGLLQTEVLNVSKNSELSDGREAIIAYARDVDNWRTSFLEQRKATLEQMRRVG